MLTLALLAGLIITILALAAGCAVPAGTATGGGDTSSTILMFAFIIGMFGVLYFLMIRPQKKRQKQHQTLVEGLQKGDHVVTIGGIHGQIESIDQNSIVLKVESGANIRFVKDAISGKVTTHQ
ncbi:MAG: preprotein translocase subunit YajC [Dehalococcoidales bacterium]|nr:preprotein translocase subunit YajC [Dehalococcoidales bacterium]